MTARGAARIRQLRHFCIHPGFLNACADNDAFLNVRAGCDAFLNMR
jgi:hypothetical protein